MPTIPVTWEAKDLEFEVSLYNLVRIPQKRGCLGV